MDSDDFGETLPSGGVVFAPGETSKLVAVQVTGDLEFEADESFLLELSNPSPALTSVTVASARMPTKESYSFLEFVIVQTRRFTKRVKCLKQFRELWAWGKVA